METDLIKNLGAIAGIGGISLGVFFFLFRDVLRTKIFPQLTKEQAHHTINRFISLTTLVAVFGIIAWVAVKIISSKSVADIKETNIEEKVKPGLELVDLSFITDTEEFPVLDIKLRNTGEVAFIKSALFKVEKASELKHPSSGCESAEPVNWTYDAMLPVLNGPYEVNVPVSQSIVSGGVDRFAFKVGTSGIQALSSALLIVTVDLIYDGDNKVLSTQKFALISRSAVSIMAYSTCRRDPRPVYVANKAVANSLNDFEGVMSSGTDNFYQSYSTLVEDLIANVDNKESDEETIRYFVEFLQQLVQIGDAEAESAINKLKEHQRDLVKSIVLDTIKST